MTKKKYDHKIIMVSFYFKVIELYRFLIRYLHLLKICIDKQNSRPY